MASDPLRHHHAHRRVGDMGDGVIGRLADRIAEGIGTVQFLLVALVLIVLWIMVNGGYGYFSGAIARLQHGQPFDVAPWILLNLIFSFEAFFTGSLVVIAQKAQSKRDRAREEADAKHRQELAEDQTARIEENTAITEMIRELIKENTALTVEIHALMGRDAGAGAHE